MPEDGIMTVVFVALYLRMGTNDVKCKKLFCPLKMAQNYPVELFFSKTHITMN
jgi:hypothetical protein